MDNNYENQIFHEELRKLRNEYDRCEDVIIKRAISKDIELLENALETI